MGPAARRVIEVLGAVQSGDQHRARCPAHEDKAPSLSVRPTETGVVVHCHAGCDTVSVLSAVGLTLADLFDDPKRAGTTDYVYRDRDGNARHGVTRSGRGKNKRIRQWTPTGDGRQTSGTAGVTPCLYRLQEMRAEAARGGTVLVVEGELDADSAAAVGRTATCNVGGAGKWRPEYAEDFRGASRVVVVADKDEPGRKHAATVAASLRGVVGEVEVVEAAVGKDLTDHLDAGRPVADLVPVAVEAVPPASTWVAVPLGSVMRGAAADDPPLLLQRSDGRCLIYPGKIHTAQGEPESFKGWFALHAAEQAVSVGESVVYIDFEDSPTGVGARLVSLGLDPDAVDRQFTYIRPDEPLGSPESEGAVSAALALGPALVVLDGVTEAMAQNGLDLKDNADAAAFLQLMPRRFASRGAAVLMIDHVTKSKDSRGRWAIGAQHKLAGIDGAVFSLEVEKPFARGRDGLVYVSVSKDRPGHVRAASTDKGRVADFVLASLPDGAVRLRLDPPSDGHGAGGVFRPTHQMEQVSRALESESGLSKRGIRELVKGKHEWVDRALELLVAEGYAATRVKGAYSVYDSALPFRESVDGAPDAIF